MNYAFMSFSCPGLPLGEALDLAKASGYAGFEPRIDAGHAHGIEPGMPKDARRAARALAGDKGVSLCCLASSVKLASRRALAENMDAARRAVELCVDLGIPRVRVFGGPIDEGQTRREAVEQVARALDALSAEIGGADVCLCMETHDSWCEPEHVAAVMRLCRGRHVGVNWDLMHPLLAAHADMRETFGLLRPYIRHVHVHGGTYEGGLKFLPIEGNVIDHRLALGELISMNYDGWLSGEWIGWDRPGYLTEELSTLRRYEEELRCTR
ncbi:MAG: sugar phosphate isomerase/epimerase [Clostridia bacterium]|nr:sugar phosphate isomerase/epimerase [Clostridia bacterium]